MKDLLKQETIDDLCKVYGEIMVDYEASNDHFEKLHIEHKLMLISHILGFPFDAKTTSLYNVVKKQ